MIETTPGIGAMKTLPTTGSVLPWKFLTALPRIWQSCTWHLGYILLLLFGNLTVSGRENIPQGTNQPLLLVANHASDLDGIILLSAFPPGSKHFPLYYIAKPTQDFKELWRRLLYPSWFLWMVGAVPITSKTHDYAKALERHEQLLREGHTVAIFPQGGWFSDGRRKPARGGVMYLAEVTGACVIPVHITGVAHMTLWTFLFGKNNIRIHYGKPVDYRSFMDYADGDDRYKSGAARLMAHIYELDIHENHERNLETRP